MTIQLQHKPVTYEDLMTLYDDLTALDNNTPAEICGIKIEGQNKWTTVIQNASLIQNQS